MTLPYLFVFISLTLFLVVVILILTYHLEIKKRREEKGSTEVDYKNLAMDLDFVNKQSRAILDSISEAVLGLNSAGKIVFYNSFAEKLLGWEELEVVSRQYTAFLLLYPSGQSYIINDLQEKFTKDLKIFNKEGQGVSVRIINSPILDDSAKFLGNVLTVRDISKEKELEEMKFDFVSMAAHELRSPVTIIRVYLTAIAEETTSTDLKVQKFIRRAMVTTDQLRVLVENLLNISQIEKGSLQINQEEIVWEELISKIVDDFAPKAEEKKIAVTFEKPKKKLPKVYVDVFRISEVLNNLFSNALNYTEEGGTVKVKTEVKNNFVVTSVEDTGIGMAQKAIPYLFQKFYRVTENMESGKSGTGLGLYISKTIVLRHGGRIWVESKLGKGSTFYFTAPIVS